MKHTLRILFTISLLAVLGMAAVHAQSIQAMRVDIPFKFTVNKLTLPAGEYIVQDLRNHRGALLIRSADGHTAEIFLTNSVQAQNTREEATLVFNRYGNQYFLSQIWQPGIGLGRQLNQTRVEKELAKSTGKDKSEFAYISARPESTLNQK